MLRVNVIGIPKVLAHLTRVEQMPTPVQMKKVEGIALRDVQNHFKQSGPGWDENAPATLRKKRGRKPLIDKHKLERSIRAKATRRTVSVSTNVVYAAIHNYGGNSGKNGMTTIPQRLFLYISHAAMSLVKKILGEAPK